MNESQGFLAGASAAAMILFVVLFALIALAG